jgi:pimeloyl-ACP methyl ester carboxylesterase
VVAALALVACAGGSNGADPPRPTADSTPHPPPAAPSVAPADPPPPASNDPPCDRAPCAARPVVFVHGQGGSNSDGQSILDAMTSAGERWDHYTWLGTSDHDKLATRSIPRREWLFAFDYYVLAGKDARGSYTSGPGRIGSDRAFPCATPKGEGHLVADSPSYDDEITHEYATDLASAIADVLRATGATKVDIVAHSMGGLITRSFLDFFGGNAQVERVMFLASPHLGVPFATLGSYFIGKPWMGAHELTELDQGSFFAKSKFALCGADAGDAWSKQLLAFEAKAPLAPELHCMSGSKDPIVSYESAHHPQCVDHVVVDGVDHTGLLHANETTNAVRALLGGTY